jgi:PPM family protein phosphatase
MRAKSIACRPEAGSEPGAGMNTFLAEGGARVEFATLSGQGARKYNEDACGYWTSPDASCFIVCDGAGGHGGGDVASETAVRTLLSAFSAAPSLEPAHIESLIAQTDSAIRYGQTLAGSLSKMSATVTALFLDGRAQRAQWAHLGDTRLYHFRRRSCRCMTKDHSVVQSFVDAGVIEASEMRHHARRNLLYAGLGMGDGTAAEALPGDFIVEDGDAFLICTDGFWDALEEQEMVDLLMRSESAQEWLVQMEQPILERADASQDNYSALAVWIGRPCDVTQPWPGPAVDTLAELLRSGETTAMEGR